MRLDETNPDNMIKEYFDIKVESGIIIREEEIQYFYNKNIKELINTLRMQSDIRVRLED